MSAVSPGGAPDKHAAVRAMFGRIAGRYDLMNGLMTGGLDRWWRRLTTDAAAVPADGLALDVGTGTGDLALALAGRVPGARIVGLDYTASMLWRASAKAGRAGLADRVTWVLGDGQRLPFPDAVFDAVTSAFLLRNVVDLGAALTEMARVTRPGGRVVALEISPDVAACWRPFIALYLDWLVPRLGGWLGGDPAAYAYLPASVAAFPRPDAVAERMRAVGLEPRGGRRLLQGAIVIHVGVRAGDGAPRRPGAPYSNSG